VSTQAPEQSVWPAGQLAAQAPLAQTGVAPEQAWSQSPQWAGSLLTSTQAGPQSLVPAGQPQVPPLQTCPAGQAAPQLPQLSGSVWVSTQVPKQKVVPGGQLD
jgi:hypothetical protein